MKTRDQYSLWRLPRSGSTMLLRSLRVLVDIDNQGHSFFTPHAPLIVTVRNPRDVLMSHWRIFYNHESETPEMSQLEDAKRSVWHRYDTLFKMEKAFDVFSIWQYELHRHHMIEWLEYALDIEITEAQAIEIDAICDPKAAKAIADGVEVVAGGKPFNSFDMETGIHREHIGALLGEPGGWRDVLPEEYRPWMDKAAGWIENKLAETGLADYK